MRARPLLFAGAPVAQRLFDYSESLGADASTAAAEDADKIITAARDAREYLIRISMLIILALLLALAGLFSLLVRPLVRLSGALALAHEGYHLTRGHEAIEELQVLSDAAAALAEGHRLLGEKSLELEQLAHSDMLTGLANRRKFIATAVSELDRNDRYLHTTSLIMFDLDHFKVVNDSYGHETGDAVLRALGNQLGECVRHVDLLARLGGEEFGVLLPEFGLTLAATAAERLRVALEKLEIPLPSGETLRVTGSFGVAERVRSGETVEELMHRADSALYRAKASGRNKVETAPQVEDFALPRLSEALKT